MFRNLSATPPDRGIAGIMERPAGYIDNDKPFGATVSVRSRVLSLVKVPPGRNNPAGWQLQDCIYRRQFSYLAEFIKFAFNNYDLCRMGI